jgi:hypothetical protein
VLPFLPSWLGVYLSSAEMRADICCVVFFIYGFGLFYNGVISLSYFLIMQKNKKELKIRQHIMKNKTNGTDLV